MNGISLNLPVYNLPINKEKNVSFGLNPLTGDLSPRQRVYKTGIREFAKIVPASAVGFALGDVTGGIVLSTISKIILDLVGVVRSLAGAERYVSDLNFIKYWVKLFQPALEILPKHDLVKKLKI